MAKFCDVTHQTKLPKSPRNIKKDGTVLKRLSLMM